MRCPYCKTPVASGAQDCPRCRMTLEKVTKLFGVVPRLDGGISDEAGVLSESAKRRIRVSANELSIKFPQTQFSVVTANLPEDSSLGLFSFWIFNEAAIVRQTDRGVNNHDILLTLDPTFARANLTVGYGLESFISEEQLSAILEVAMPSLAERKFTVSIEQVIGAMSDELTSIATNLPQTHGVAPLVTAKKTEAVSPADF